jgi:hypothetical protein
VGLERDPLSLVNITEELLEWKGCDSGSRKSRLTAVGSRCADHAIPCIRKKLVLTSQASGGRSVGIVRLRTKAMEFVCLIYNNAHLWLGTEQGLGRSVRLKPMERSGGGRLNQNGAGSRSAVGTPNMIKGEHMVRQRTQFLRRHKLDATTSHNTTRYSDGLRVRFLAGARDISLLQRAQASSADRPASCLMGSGGFFPGVKRPRLEADYSPPYNAEVKNGLYDLVPK